MIRQQETEGDQSINSKITNLGGGTVKALSHQKTLKSQVYQKLDSIVLENTNSNNSMNPTTAGKSTQA